VFGDICGIHTKGLISLTFAEQDALIIEAMRLAKILSIKFKQARDKQNDLHFEDLRAQAEDEIMVEEDDEAPQVQHHQSSSDENSKILKEL